MRFVVATLLATASFLSPISGFAESADVEATIKNIDMSNLSLTLDDGKTYQATGPVAENLYQKLSDKQIDYRVEPEDLVAGGVAGGQDQHPGAVARGAQLAAQRQPVAVGQAEVEHDEVIRADRDRTAGTGQGALEVDGVTVLDQATLHDTAERRIIFHQEHTHEPTSSHTDDERVMKREFTAVS